MPFSVTSPPTSPQFAFVFPKTGTYTGRHGACSKQPEHCTTPGREEGYPTESLLGSLTAWGWWGGRGGEARKGTQTWHIQNLATLGRCWNQGPAVFLLPPISVLKGVRLATQTRRQTCLHLPPPQSSSYREVTNTETLLRRFVCDRGKKNTIVRPTI
jgi:hypothetical protein